MKIRNLKKLGIDGPKKGNLIIVLLSKWCKSCKLLSPMLKQFEYEYFIKIKEIDISEHGKFARELNINAVPAFIFVKDGEILNKNIKAFGESLVNEGIMIGSFNEMILKEVIKQLYFP
ncbi:MAG: thioredoxin family protein [Promethearchaeota archaeon]